MKILDHCGPVLSADEQTQLALRAQQGDEYAENLLIERNLLLIRNLVEKHMEIAGVGNKEDIILAGARGLQHAITKFDPSKDCQLMSYARHWIKQYAWKECKRIRDLIHIPVAAHNNKREDLRNAAKNAFLVHSLHGPESDMNRDENPALCIDETPADHCMQSMDKPVINAHLRACVSRLPDDLQTIMNLRFGLDGHGPRTLQEESDIIGVTLEACRMREVKGLRMLRELMDEEGD